MLLRALTAAVLLLGATDLAAAHGSAKHVKANLEPVDKEFGKTGSPDRVSRTIELKMSDQMKFSPSQIRVAKGETIRFRLANPGDLLHEMVIGTEKELLEHAELMKKFPDMEHAEPYMSHVPEKAEGEILWTFDKPGVFHFGCLIPGHWENGMRGTITVF